MAKSPELAHYPAGYFAWSRDPAVGLFAVLPLWVLYESLRLSLSPDERNGAEVLLFDGISTVWPAGLHVIRGVMLLIVLISAWSILKRDVPWGRVAMVSALEGTVYGLLLGPLAAAMATSSFRVLAFAPALRGDDSLAADLVGALGAGIFEELVFRLGLMSLLAWLLLRLTKMAQVASWVAVVGSILISALVFSYFHHIPVGNPFEPEPFVFRTMAGILLGGLFVLRGFGVCVYCHAIYDVHFYLTEMR